MVVLTPDELSAAPIVIRAIPRPEHREDEARKVMAEGLLAPAACNQRR